MAIEAPLLGVEAGRRLEGFVAALGPGALVDCFRQFAFEGRRTPAPIAPTARLV